MGRLQASKGSIKVFGKTPGEPGSRVPGASIGYMPQELALFPDFTVEETLTYFGRLYHLKDKVIGQRMEFLLKFLDLSDKRRLVGNLSGGQKRRVSLAASLVHNPPLLILDGKTKMEFQTNNYLFLRTNRWSGPSVEAKHLGLFGDFE